MTIIRSLIIMMLSTASLAYADPAVTAWGTATESIVTISAPEFSPNASSLSYSAFNRSRYSSNGGYFYAGLRLPSGSAVQRIKLDACDVVDIGEVTAQLVRCSTSPSTSCTTVATAATGVLFNSFNCGSFETVLAAPEVIDNEDFIYYLHIENNGNFSGGTRFNGVRVYYKLQVSPAPAVASFGDVPTSHPFFQFIEALAASGITSGCSAGNFCPNDPLTRGQMAVFLSRALGLHWAP